MSAKFRFTCTCEYVQNEEDETHAEQECAFYDNELVLW